MSSLSGTPAELKLSNKSRSSFLKYFFRFSCKSEEKEEKRGRAAKDNIPTNAIIINLIHENLSLNLSRTFHKKLL